MSRGAPVFITLGSNIEPEKNLIAAARLLADALPGVRFSPVFQTSPVDALGRVNPHQPSFLNAAARAETSLPAAVLKLHILIPIESRLGRVRTHDRFAPRTIDLDLALVGDEVSTVELQTPHGAVTLVLPDPDILTRAHVALPLARLDPDMIHPGTGERLRDIAARLADDPGIRVCALTLGD